MDSASLVWMLAVPAVAGLVAYLTKRRAAWFVHALTLAVAVWLLVMAVRLLGATGLRWEWHWMNIGTATVSVALLATRFGAVIALFVAAFGVLVTLYSIGYTTREVGRHNAYMLWTLAGAMGAALANNLLFFLISWEVVTLMLFLLINTGGEKAKAGAAKTFTILGLSDCAMLLAIVLLATTVSGATLAMDELSVSVGSPLTVVCFLLILAGALAKAGAVPLHTWIPAAAEGAPTDVMAFLPASLDKLLGIYLLARASLEFFTLTEGLKILVMIIGAVTIVSAVMMAMIQHDLKKLLSYHAVSQVGYMVLGIGTGTVIGVAGGLFHMINNAIYKNALFLTAGAVEKRAGTTELDRLGGLAKVMPLSFFACLISAMAISGIPPFNGFASKWLIYQAALGVPHWIAPALVAAAIFGSALTLASFVKVIHSVFLGTRPAALLKASPREAPGWMTTPAMILALACIVFGVAATVPLRAFVVPAMETLGIEGLGSHLEGGTMTTLTKTMWSSGQATVLLLSALVLGLVIYAVGGAFRTRRTSIYVGGEVLPPQTAHYSGTGFYDTVRRLPGLRAVFYDAEREAFDVYHIGGRFGSSLVEGLRRLQTGVLTLYVSWVVLGLLIILMYLLRMGAAE